MAIDIKRFQKKLVAEKKLLEAELGQVGRRNPDNLADWEATPTDKDPSQADENTVANGIADYEDNVAIVNTLETQYQDLKIALDKIENGTYGICEIGGEEIDEERLEANPSARNCRKHMK